MKKIFLYAVLATIICAPVFPAFGALPSAPTHAAESKEVNPDELAAQNAMRDFKNLSRKEKREKFKDVKDAVKQFKQDKSAGNAPSTDTLLLVVLAILIPPLAVYLHEGAFNNRFWLSLLLTLLFFVPGVIYALIVVLGD